MPNYEITISVHVPDELVTLAGRFEKTDVSPATEDQSTLGPAPTVTPGVRVTEPPKPITIEDAKAAILDYAKAHDNVTAAKLLAEKFGVKLKEIDESQAATIHAFFISEVNN